MFIYLRDGTRIELPDATTVSIEGETVLIVGREGQRLASLRKVDLLAFSHRDIGEVWPNRRSTEDLSPSTK